MHLGTLLFALTFLGQVPTQAEGQPPASLPERPQPQSVLQPRPFEIPPLGELPANSFNPAEVQSPQPSFGGPAQFGPNPLTPPDRFQQPPAQLEPPSEPLRFGPQDSLAPPRLLPPQETPLPNSGAPRQPEIEAARQQSAPPVGLTSINTQERTSAPLLLRQAITPPSAEQALAGRPLSLEEAFRNVPEARRARLIECYWSLAVAVGRFYFVAAEADWLAALPRPHSTADQTLLAGAQLSCIARARAAELDVVRAQFHLVEAMGTRESQSLPPLAADAPLVTAYRTRYETFFSTKPAPPELERIHLTLPHHLELVDARARAAMAADEEFRAGIAAYEQGQIDVVRLLNSYERLSRERSRFLDDLLAYNRDIATYALGVAGSVDTASVVGMLIERSASGPPRGEPLSLQPQPALPANPGVPRVDPAVQPASAEEPVIAGGSGSAGVLRSVLVRPAGPRSQEAATQPSAAPQGLPPATPRLFPLDPSDPPSLNPIVD